ncbi:MAG: Hsp33 family molecular chaperone HslO [Erysipelotrichaceae bacterium]
MDKLIRGLAHNKRLRVFIVRTTELVEKARAKHLLWPTSAAALGRVLNVATMMGSMLKGEKEQITIQINGGGPLGTILVRSYYDGRVKGFVANPDVMLINNNNGKLAVGKAVGIDGYLKVSKDLNLKNDFTGQVKLISGELAEDFAYYFNVSEQTPSFVSVGVLVNEDSTIKASGGIIIQLMPEANEKDILFIENIAKDLKPISTLIAENKTPEQIAGMIFDDFELLATGKPYFGCDCSKERMFVALTSLNKEDLEVMIKEDDGCEMHCEFCNSKYKFTGTDLQAILNKRK